MDLLIAFGVVVALTGWALYVLHKRERSGRTANEEGRRIEAGARKRFEDQAGDRRALSGWAANVNIAQRHGIRRY